MDWNNINTDKDTSGLGPIEYDQSKVPTLIRKHADNVRGKSYGQQVREAQARNAEIAGLIADEARTTADTAHALSTDTQNRFKDQIEGTTNSDEVIDARRPALSETSFATLGERLSYQDENIEDVSTNVKRFGAVGNGTYDSSDAFQSANDYLVSKGGGVLHVPKGVYCANFIIDSNVQLIGDGVGISIIKSVPGSNLDVIKSRDFDVYTGTTADVGYEGLRFVTIDKLTIDGNKQNNMIGAGLKLWGCYLNFTDLIVQNCADDGIWTEFTSILPPTNETVRESALESIFRNIKIFYCQGNAWTFNGPHDSIIDNYVAIGNKGWSFYQRDFNSFVTMENVNTWKNGNGIRVGTGIAGHDIVTDNDGTGIGIEFSANTGNSRMVNVRLSGWDKGIIAKGQAQRITGVVANSRIALEIDALSLSEISLSAYNNQTTLNVISEIAKNNYEIIASVPSGGVLTSGVPLRSDDNVSINSGGTGYQQFAENLLKVKGWSFTFPQNNGEILTDGSAPTTLKRGGVKTQNALPDVTAAPTAGEFNTLLSRLRAAGILAQN